jgi:hypothetical protein
VLFEGNSFHAITTPAHNPVLIEHDQNSHASTWVVETEGRLPFGWRARAVEAVVMKGKIKNTSNVTEYTMPYVSVEEGSDGSDVHLNWEKSVKGTVWTKIRMD